MQDSSSSGWHPDPLGHFEQRFWDGARWTSDVVSEGRQSIDPPMIPSPAPVSERRRRRIRGQIRRARATSDRPGGGTLFTEPTLVMHQKAKRAHAKAEYAVYDQSGMQIASAREVSRIGRGKALHILDATGGLLLVLTRPPKLLQFTTVVTRANGSKVGVIERKRFSLTEDRGFTLSSGQEDLGTVDIARRPMAKVSRFDIRDADGTEIGRVVRAHAGLAKQWFTNADHYVVTLHHSLTEPLRSLAIAAVFAADRGLNNRSRREEFEAFVARNYPSGE